MIKEANPPEEPPRTPSPEAKLREIEERYRSLVAASLDAVLLTIPGGGILSANEAACRMFGYSEEELVGKAPCGIGDPTDPRLALALEERARTGRFHGELTFVRKDGTKFPGEVSSAVFATRHGEQRTSMVIRDITERRRMEDELRAANRALAELIDSSPLAIVALDREGLVRMWNPLAAALFGWSEAEALDKPLPIVPPDKEEEFRQLFARALGGQHTRGIELRRLRKDGSPVDVQLWTARLENLPRGNAGVFGMFVDVSERKRAEDALRELSSRQEAILAAVPDIIMEVNRDKVYTWANPAGIEFFGDEMLGKEASSFYVGEQDTYGAVQPLFEGEEGVFYVESWQRRRDGETRLLAWWCRALKDEQGLVRGALSSARDITERRLAEEALAKYQKQLQALASELAQSEDLERRRIAVYLHDQVGQSLAAVRVKFAAWKGMEPSPKRQLLLSEIERLIDQTIDDTRFLTFDLSPPILHELGLGPALEWLGENLCEKEGIVFEFLDDGHSGKMEEVLAGALYRIVRELLLNAVKHAQASRVSVLVSVNHDGIHLVVKDDGIGMDRSRYGQALKGAGGTYGLFSIHERLRQLNGSLSIESNPGGGTRMMVAAPLSHSVSSQSGGLA